MSNFDLDFLNEEEFLFETDKEDTSLTAEPDDEDLEMNALEENALENLAEALCLAEATKIIRLTKESQIANLTGRSALILARRAKDPLFAKYAKFNGIRLTIKAQIQKKYASKAQQYGRKLYTNAQRAAAQKASSTTVRKP